jgi:SAM-dependent methyltransferase
VTRFLKFARAAVKTSPEDLLPEDRLPYDKFADVYNRFFAPEAAGATLAALRRLLLRDLPAESRILDLCCGSGQLSRALLDLRYQVTGIDSSAGMLRHARNKSPGVEFLQADIREFGVTAPFDAVVCAYNSLAHLDNVDALAKAFCNVERSLVPGGKVVFDLYSEEAFQQRWQGSFSKVDEDFVCIFQPQYDAASREAENQVTTFHRDGDWVRSDFILRQHCFTRGELLEALTAAGFNSFETFDAEYDLGIHDAAGRIFWRCERDAKPAR